MPFATGEVYAGSDTETNTYETINMQAGCLAVERRYFRIKAHKSQISKLSAC